MWIDASPMWMNRDEHGSRADLLSRLPLGGRDRRIVILVPHDLFIGVDHSDEDAVVFLERRRVGRHVESIRDVDRAAERRFRLTPDRRCRDRWLLGRTAPASAERRG